MRLEFEGWQSANLYRDCDAGRCRAGGAEGSTFRCLFNLGGVFRLCHLRDRINRATFVWGSCYFLIGRDRTTMSPAPANVRRRLVLKRPDRPAVRAYFSNGTVAILNVVQVERRGSIFARCVLFDFGAGRANRAGQFLWNYA